MNKKEFYTSPEVEAFEVRYEGVVCASGDGTPNPWAPGNSNWFNDD